MSSSGPNGINGHSSSTQSADTYNTSTSTTTARDFGFTGQNGIDLAGVISAAGVSGVNRLSDSLDRLVNGAGAVQLAGFDFSNHSQDTAANMFNQTTARLTDTLTGLINAERDFTQRNTNASLGVASAIQQLPAAESNVPVDSGFRWNSPIVIVALLGVAVTLYSMRKK